MVYRSFIMMTVRVVRKAIEIWHGKYGSGCDGRT